VRKEWEGMTGKSKGRDGGKKVEGKEEDRKEERGRGGGVSPLLNSQFKHGWT